MVEKRKRGNKIFNPDSFSLLNHPFYLFNHIFLHRGRELNHELSQYDVDYSKWRVLAVLNECPNCTMQILADTAGVDRTSLTHTVRLMIEAGLVTKTTRQSDRRSVVLSLTDEGISTFKKVLPIVIKNNERCFADFSEEEIQSFMHTLRRIILNIKTESAASGPDDVVVDYELSNSIFPAKAFPRRSSSKGR
ncbi:Transcriptional regulator SlyA [compost metagenome]